MNLKLNHKIRVEGSSKTLLVHHNRLKPRSEPVVTPREPTDSENQNETDSGAASRERHAPAAPAAVAEANSSAGSAGILVHLPILVNAGTAVHAESRPPVSDGGQDVDGPPSDMSVSAAPLDSQSTPALTGEAPPPVPARRSERRTRPPDRFVP